jgi:hypothetical protein
MSDNLFSTLPEEILALEIIEKIDDRASPFVLSKVNRFFWNLFADRPLRTNPVIDFINIESFGLVEWDQEGPAPSQLTFEVAEAAASAPTVKYLRYLVERGCPLNEKAFYSACSRGHLENLRFLFGKMKVAQLNHYAAVAGERNHFEIVKYLVQEKNLRFLPDDFALTRAARSGNKVHISVI